MNKNLIDYLLISELSKDYLPRMPIGDIFHYTSSNTLKNILFEHKQVVLHASRYELLNDTMEGIYIFEVYKEACEELFEDRKISKNFLGIILKARYQIRLCFLLLIGIPMSVQLRIATIMLHASLRQTIICQCGIIIQKVVSMKRLT